MPLTICVRAHPVNYWFLRLFAVAYLAIDGGPVSRVQWGTKTTWNDLQPGAHSVILEVRYKGFTRPASTMRASVELGTEKAEEFAIINGPLNQDPFQIYPVG